MSFPASGESFALAIKSPRARLPFAMPWTLLTIRNASDFVVNTDNPDASQLPIHFLGRISAQDSKSLADGGFEWTSLNTSADASLASEGGHFGGKKDGQFTVVILLLSPFVSWPVWLTGSF
jgi:hypothetical protein